MNSLQASDVEFTQDNVEVFAAQLADHLDGDWIVSGGGYGYAIMRCPMSGVVLNVGGREFPTRVCVYSAAYLLVPADIKDEVLLFGVEEPVTMTAAVNRGVAAIARQVTSKVLTPAGQLAVEVADRVAKAREHVAATADIGDRLMAAAGRYGIDKRTRPRGDNQIDFYTKDRDTSLKLKFSNNQVNIDGWVDAETGVALVQWLADRMQAKG
jgi:hypothetical protein